ncbi:RluA family pseudouridine synthase [Candidatus Peregrinibacteria bacterium]|nr:MAG: RluA family pseudouridine synthase [Candidatus Peregrinibacteria bacterium]
MKHFTVDDKGADRRLDQYLSSVRPDLTRAFVQKMIKGGSVFVNQKKITKASHSVQKDDELVVLIPSIKEVGIVAEDIPLDVVYEDHDMLVINKPAGMVVHPTDHGSHVSGTLVNAVMHYCHDSLSGIGGDRRPGIVHRLDKQTSGLIMVAKHDGAHRALAHQIESRSIVKEYITLLKGRLKPKEGSIEAPLKAQPKGGRTDVQISNSITAKYALTHYHVQEYLGEYSLVNVRIITGRTHQIRVHFAAIGHPVVGDEMYGDATTNQAIESLSGLRRQFLHAAQLTFRLPKNDEEITLTSELPDDLSQTIETLKVVS